MIGKKQLTMLILGGTDAIHTLSPYSYNNNKRQLKQ